MISLKNIVKEIKKKSMKSISKLGREKKDLKKEHDRMSAYMYSREIKYCDKCRKYGDYHEGYGDFVYNDDTCEYICHECEDYEEPEEVDTCNKCNKKRENISDMFITHDETMTGGEKYMMCGMCSLNHFKSK